MSGGSRNYFYRELEEQAGEMRDRELDELVRDLAKVMHDLEWWESCDYGESAYRETVREFKRKWFGGGREEVLQNIVEKSCAELKAELMEMIGGKKSGSMLA